MAKYGKNIKILKRSTINTWKKWHHSKSFLVCFLVKSGKTNRFFSIYLWIISVLKTSPLLFQGQDFSKVAQFVNTCINISKIVNFGRMVARVNQTFLQHWFRLDPSKLDNHGCVNSHYFHKINRDQAKQMCASVPIGRNEITNTSSWQLIGLHDIMKYA